MCRPDWRFHLPEKRPNFTIIATESKLMTDRRWYLSCAFWLLALGAALSFDSRSVAAQELKISHQFAARVDARDQAAQVFIDEARKLAPHLKFGLYPESALKIKPAAQFDALVSGQLAMSVYPLEYAAPKVPEFAIATFPFIPADLKMAMRLKGSPFHARLQRVAEANGVHILTWWWLAGSAACKNGTVIGPDTVKGVRLRTPGGSLDGLFGKAGAAVKQHSASSEMYQLLRDGTLDCAVTSMESLVSYRIFEQSVNATLGGYKFFMIFEPLLISKIIWDGLTVDEQTALERAAEIADVFFEGTQKEAEQKTTEAFQKAGAKVGRLELADYEAWLKMSKDEIWPGYRKLSQTADELFVSLLQSAMRHSNGDAGASQTTKTGNE